KDHKVGGGERGTNKVAKHQPQHRPRSNLEQNNSKRKYRTRGPINDIDEELSDPYSIVNVIRDVKKLPGMEPGSKLLAQSSHVLRDIELRKLYVAQGDEDSKLRKAFTILQMIISSSSQYHNNSNEEDCVNT
ncbi:hypothetical protein Lal_00028357, partial [Lupinus albus]